MSRYTPICANFAVPQALSMDIIQSDLQFTFTHPCPSQEGNLFTIHDS
jgi:hypothetical protein